MVSLSFLILLFFFVFASCFRCGGLRCISGHQSTACAGPFMATSKSPFRCTSLGPHGKKGEIPQLFLACPQLTGVNIVPSQTMHYYRGKSCKVSYNPKTNMDTQNDALEKVVPALNMAIFGIYIRHCLIPPHTPGWFEVPRFNAAHASRCPGGFGHRRFCRESG